MSRNFSVVLHPKQIFSHGTLKSKIFESLLLNLEFFQAGCSNFGIASEFIETDFDAILKLHTNISADNSSIQPFKQIFRFTIHLTTE